MGTSSSIGRALETRAQIWAAGFTGSITLAADFLLSQAHSVPLYRRALLALAALGILLWLARCDRSSLGLRLRPAQGWRYWVNVSTIAAGSILLISAIYFLVVPESWKLLVLLGEYTRYSGFWSRFVFSCVQVPLIEETLYRVVLCVSFISVLGPAPTICLSGVLFAALHFVYGNPAPDNVIAGFVLGWAYVKSGAVSVPILMHSIGNLAAVAIQLAAAALSR
jgi:uncharacterized protein